MCLISREVAADLGKTEGVEQKGKRDHFQEKLPHGFIGGIVSFSAICSTSVVQRGYGEG